METQISLFSNDESLVRFVRESVTESLGNEFSLNVKAPGQPPSGQGLCIWDFVPGETAFPPRIGENEWRKHLFLLHRKDLGVLQSLVSVSDVNMLLKPVTRAALRAFLDGYGWQNTGSEEPGESLAALRGERDDMLHFLMQANLKLQDFHQQRTNFLARSIHDFRAPLTAISGYCDLLLEDQLDPLSEGQRNIILQRMQQSTRRLTRATDSMYQLSVAESEVPAVSVEPADIRDSIGQVLADLAPLFENKRVRVTLDVEPSPENLRFAMGQIQNVLVNLLESACKFTPRGGSIAIEGYFYFWERRTDRPAASRCATDRRTLEVKTYNSYRVDISDSGPAIPATGADKIFEESTSYSGGQDRSGAGLGMAICRMILAQHGGRVWAENRAEGAVYSFVLPLA